MFVILDIRSYAKQPWGRFVTPDNKSNVNTDGIDLLDKLLRYNHLDRLTASEALAHSFFSTYTVYLHSHPLLCLCDTPVLHSHVQSSLCCTRTDEWSLLFFPARVQMLYASRRPLTPPNA